MWPFKKLPPSNQNIEYFSSARIKILDAIDYCNQRNKEHGFGYLTFSLNDDPSRERFVINSRMGMWEIYYVRKNWRWGYQHFQEVDDLITYMGDFLNKPPNQMSAIKIYFSISNNADKWDYKYYSSAITKIYDTLMFHNKKRKEKTGTYFNFLLDDFSGGECLVINYKNKAWEIYYTERGDKQNYGQFEDVDELIVHLFKHWGGGKVPGSF